MRSKSILTNLTGRASRNVLFWLLVTFYLEAGQKAVWPAFPALLCVMLLSYGVPGYVHNLLIIPRFFITRKYALYLLSFGLLLMLTTVGSYYETHWINNLIPGLNYMGNLKDVAMPYHAFPSIIMLSFLAFGKFMSDAIQNQLRVEQLEKQRLTSELDTLRAQINPHFLFNALNTVYGMARRTDMQTADAIMKLSDILRYGLYDCEDHEASLDMELLYLKQYVEFAQLRVHDQDSIRLQIDVPAMNNKKIAPMLLTPFVENAIKHGLSGTDNNNKIEVRVYLQGDNLHFLCTNGYFIKPNDSDNMSTHNGIGNKNVKRRLELLYSGKYELHITNSSDQFSVDLNLKLQ